MYEKHESNMKNAETAEKVLQEKLPERYVTSRTAYAIYLLRAGRLNKILSYEEWKKKHDSA